MALTVPQTAYVRGNFVLDNMPTFMATRRFGKIPMIIHQTWKSERFNPKMLGWFNSWSIFNPQMVHILWLDEDNDRLVNEHFPQYKAAYDSMHLIIQKTDFVRLMYLYLLGGVYADADYECYKPILASLPQTYGVMFVSSKLLLSESVQNSLMVSEPQHPVILKCLDIINTITTDLNQPEKTNMYPAHFISLLRSPLFKKLAETLITLQKTGPGVLDRAVSRMAFDKDPGTSDLVRLDEPTFMHGSLDNGVACHKYMTSWFDIGELSALPVAIGVTSLVILLILVIIITWAATRASSRHK